MTRPGSQPPGSLHSADTRWTSRARAVWSRRCSRQVEVPVERGLFGWCQERRLSGQRGGRVALRDPTNSCMEPNGVPVSVAAPVCARAGFVRLRLLDVAAGDYLGPTVASRFTECTIEPLLPDHVPHATCSVACKCPAEIGRAARRGRQFDGYGTTRKADLTRLRIPVEGSRRVSHRPRAEFVAQSIEQFELVQDSATFPAPKLDRVGSPTNNVSSAGSGNRRLVRAQT
jgi:hypothetical protein